jgi:hypothetical protein
MFRATSRRSVFASTRSTVEGVRHRGIRYPGLYSPHDWRPR